MSKQHTCPLIINDNPEGQNILRLEKINLGWSQHKGEKLYDEDWIQGLIHENPSILPVEELESAFFPLYPVCRELKTPAGYLDNLFVSENGSLTLVECKLWRNPEARRAVIGQALDYAKEFASWTYEELNNAIQESTGRNGNLLFESVAKDIDELEESRFVDSVSRNLSKGRFLILIVGDGIREGVEKISKFLQQHAGLGFTFGLVELGIFKIPQTNSFIVQPRILTRTYTVERIVFQADGDQNSLMKPETETVSRKATSRRTTISEEQFFEELSTAHESSSTELKKFLDALSSLDIFPSYGSSSLNLRWLPADNLRMNFGSIIKTGVVDTSPSNWMPDRIGKIQIGHNYQKRLASIIPLATVREHEKSGHWEVHKDDKRITIEDLLAVKEEWMKVINSIQDEILLALSS